MTLAMPPCIGPLAPPQGASRILAVGGRRRQSSIGVASDNCFGHRPPMIARNERESIAARPVLAAPPRFRGQLPFFRYVRTVRENTIASLPAEAFEEDVLERRMLGQRIFTIC